MKKPSRPGAPPLGVPEAGGCVHRAGASPPTCLPAPTLSRRPASGNEESNGGDAQRRGRSTDAHRAALRPQPGSRPRPLGPDPRGRARAGGPLTPGNRPRVSAALRPRASWERGSCTVRRGGASFLSPGLPGGVSRFCRERHGHFLGPGEQEPQCRWATGT